MYFRSLFFITLAAFIAMLAACGSSENTTSNLSTKVTNTNSPASNTKGLPEPSAKPATATTNDAPTLKPVVDAYYDALRKKDDTAVRKVLSAAAIKSAEADMKADKKNGLAAFLAEIDLREGEVQVRNEKIEGDRGIAEVKGGSLLNWTPLIFEREGGVWKYTGKSPDIDAVTKGASNSGK